MTYDDEIQKAYLILKKNNFSFLHCVSIYPTKLQDVNLNRIKFLKKFTKKIGYSDHTISSDENLIAIKLAIFYGAKIIEKHFTILETKKTRDGLISMNPKQLNEISTFAHLSKDDQKRYFSSTSKKLIKKILGDKKKTLTDIELINRDYYRGRFGSISKPGENKRHIYNWDKTDIV